MLTPRHAAAEDSEDSWEVSGEEDSGEEDSEEEEVSGEEEEEISGEEED